MTSDKPHAGLGGILYANNDHEVSRVTFLASGPQELGAQLKSNLLFSDVNSNIMRKVR